MRHAVLHLPCLASEVFGLTGLPCAVFSLWGWCCACGLQVLRFLAACRLPGTQHILELLAPDLSERHYFKVHAVHPLPEENTNEPVSKRRSCSGADGKLWPHQSSERCSTRLASFLWLRAGRAENDGDAWLKAISSSKESVADASASPVAALLIQWQGCDEG